MRRIACMLVGIVVISGGGRELHAVEPLVPPVTGTTLEGEWEGVWRDRVAGAIVVFFLRVLPKGQPRFTIVSGPAPNPFLEQFSVEHIECTQGRVDLRAVGLEDAAGESIVMVGNGWALSTDGFLDASIRKTTKNGKILTFDVRLNKLAGGFFRSAERLVAVAKKRLPKVARNR